MQDTIATITTAWQRAFPEHARALRPEHANALGTRWETWRRNGVPNDRPHPRFAFEETPSLSSLARQMLALEGADVDGWERLFRELGVEHLLVLLGQRWTSATCHDARGLPPERERLIAAASSAHDERDALSVAGRALAKHAQRSEDAHWGEVRGSSADKNATALAHLTRILDGATWWNVFEHHAHETVYEARLPSGHGARWTGDGARFIGFLDPFDAEERF